MSDLKYFHRKQKAPEYPLRLKADRQSAIQWKDYRTRFINKRLKSNIVIFNDGELDLDVCVENETVWLNRHQISELFRREAGLNSFTMSPTKWINGTNAIGLVAKSGRYGGTYAHKDIAFEFASWVSVEFKLYLIKEFQRLKEEELKQLGWDIRRNLTKLNYKIHKDQSRHINNLFKDSSKCLEFLKVSLIFSK